LSWARAIQSSEPFEVDLPIRPPGAAYFISAIWDGQASGVSQLKFAWCLLGAFGITLIYLAVLRSFGSGVALGVGLFCAASTGLMILSTSLNNEVLYLALVAGILTLWKPILQRPRAPGLIFWAILNASACLVRAEHLLFSLLLMVFLGFAWFKQSPEQDTSDRFWRSLRLMTLAVAVFALVLAPWHSRAWSAIDRFNTEPLPTNPIADASQSSVEQLLHSIFWQPQAEADLDRLPASSRRTARLFITATEAVRGNQRVSLKSLKILDQAFGYIPEPLPAHPYMALYGGLNFYLANNPGASGGFGRAPLEAPPPLLGGMENYPLALTHGLPPAALTFTYPPHLQAVNHGYRLGWEWIRGHPLAALHLAGKKLSIFWEGAALGFGGSNFPLGLSGLRRPVDLITPDSGASGLVWRSGLLLLLIIGLWIGRGSAALYPWSAFLFSKLAITIAFFGYARQGATVIPVVALLACLAIDRLTSGRSIRRIAESPSSTKWRLPLALAAILSLLALETERWAQRPQVLIDGRAIGVRAPLPTDDHGELHLEVRKSQHRTRR
jgi:hypothetical protein